MKETKKELQEKAIGVKDGLQKAGAAVGKAAGKSAEAVKNVAAGFASKVKDENVKAKKRNTNPDKLDEKSQFHLTNLLDIIEDYRVIAIKRERLQLLYDQEKASIMKTTIHMLTSWRN